MLGLSIMSMPYVISYSGTIGFLMAFSKFYFVFSLILFLQLFFFQVHSLDVDKPKDCIKRFKSNNILGFLVFINILIGKFL